MEYGEEDNCLFGKVLGLKKDCITYKGEIISELKSNFEGAILRSEERRVGKECRL